MNTPATDEDIRAGVDILIDNDMNVTPEKVRKVLFAVNITANSDMIIKVMNDMEAELQSMDRCSFWKEKQVSNEEVEDRLNQVLILLEKGLITAKETAKRLAQIPEDAVVTEKAAELAEKIAVMLEG